MKIQIVKRKAGSNKELAREVMELHDVKTLRELLIDITTITMQQQYAHKEMKQLSKEDMQAGTVQGKITFQGLYHDSKVSLDHAIATMIQDFEDGLFRVFLSSEECTSLDEPLHLQENDECVILRLIMMAGRLW